MFKNDETRALGKLTIEVKDKDGKLKQREEVKNLVVDTGLAYIASRMKDASATAMSHMAIGTGSSAAAAGNTALGTEAARVALTSTTISGIISAATNAVDFDGRVSSHQTSYQQYGDIHRDISSRPLRNGLSSEDLDMLLCDLSRGHKT